MIPSTARVSGLLAATRNAGASDAELLNRYVAERDGPAFAALVARHGSMVFGVCQRIISDWHIAEDAFQATFLVLARRAATVSPSGAVVGWLHGVAVRVAKNARRAELRRTGRERPTREPPELVAPDAPDTDLRDVIDGELLCLPRKYRELLVACDLEERDRRSVAAALGIPEGTLSSRLTAARKMLAGRLTKRGVALLITAPIALNGPRLIACEVPRMVLASAAQLGCGVTGTLPAGVASLASKVSPIVTYQALVPVTLLLLTACGALSATLTAGDAPPTIQPPAVAASIAAIRHAEPPNTDSIPSPKGPNKILFTRVFRHTVVDRHLVLIDPDGKNEEALPSSDGKYQPDDAWFSPDGLRLAVIGMDYDNQTQKSSYPLYLRKTDDKDTVTDLGVECRVVVWSADGTQLACTDYPDVWEKGPVYTHFLIDVKTKEKTILKLPNDHIITDWSRDGKYFLTTSMEIAEDSAAIRLHLMNRDGTEHKSLTDKTQLSGMGRFSPDGKRVLFGTVPYPKKDQKIDYEKATLAVLDIATGKTTKLEDIPRNADVRNLCWSPDGKQIAFLWCERHEGTPEEINEKDTTTAVVVCDPDGKNQKTIATAKGKGLLQTISGLDWR
jgi:RNA polymerase sigma factor (sigma-70 family)